MEVLQSGSAPALVTNLEVMQLLKERIAARQETPTPNAIGGGGGGGGSDDNNTSINNNSTRNNPFKNRDWIEQTVLNHLQSSPVGKINEKLLENMPKLVEQLRRDPATSGEEVNSHHHTEVGNGQPQEQLAGYGYGLTKTETLQILNHLPSSLVELHLLINDLERREHLDEDEKQLKLLRLISQFAGEPAKE